MYKLYYFPRSAALPVHMTLEEIGVAYELVKVDRFAGDLDRPEFRAMNPNGRIPVLVDGDDVFFEAMALLLHLAEKHPEAGLAPAPGTPARTRLYQWMSQLATDLQQTLMIYFYPERWVEEAHAAAEVKASAGRKINTLFDIIDRELGDGPFVLGENFSVADFHLFLLTHYGRNLDRPAAARPNIARHHARMLARKSVQSAMNAQGLMPVSR